MNKSAFSPKPAPWPGRQPASWPTGRGGPGDGLRQSREAQRTGSFSTDFSAISASRRSKKRVFQHPPSLAEICESETIHGNGPLLAHRFEQIPEAHSKQQTTNQHKDPTQQRPKQQVIPYN